MTTNQSQYEEMIIPVRCKDCKWSIKENNGSLVCDNQFGAQTTWDMFPRTAIAIMEKGERNDFTTGNLWLRRDGVPDADRAGTDRQQKTLTIRPR